MNCIFLFQRVESVHKLDYRQLNRIVMFRTETEPLALLIELTPRLAKKRFRQSIYEAWNHECAYCGAKATSLDHIVPRYKSGCSNWYNLIPACQPCNNNKASLNMEEWYRKHEKFCEKRLEKILEWTKGDKIEFIADNYSCKLGCA